MFEFAATGRPMRRRAKQITAEALRSSGHSGLASPAFDGRRTAAVTSVLMQGCFAGYWTVATYGSRAM